MNFHFLKFSSVETKSDANLHHIPYTELSYILIGVTCEIYAEHLERMRNTTLVKSPLIPSPPPSVPITVTNKSINLPTHHFPPEKRA